MPLVKQGAVVPDPFARVADDAALPEGPALVPLARLLADGLPEGRNAPLGVLVPNAADVALLAPFIGQLAVIVLDFPKFRDGRAYSQARLLRERFGFSGELRAAGNVLRDQVLLMVRCGFDAFEVAKADDIPGFTHALAAYSLVYQPTGDGRRTIGDARRAARGA
ncbi:DUF934 domain-containing protein [Aquabacter spiritensis]|uniref:Uncharacterized protein (DUF934 family) n=1 Tax=Aquabacter spiritensis TaxID=933073 RepID=A0A4R3M4H0_9HYPH|nr:DUF934 domain-containing protein [Aquabacter spiritensis]TCT08201.1 uncharacterized protein (DUF934 family) [Aquabacter spiritensis]